MSTSENNNSALILKQFNHEKLLELVEKSEQLKDYIEKFKQEKIDGELLYDIYTARDVGELKELGFKGIRSRKLFREAVDEIIQKETIFKQEGLILDKDLQAPPVGNLKVKSDPIVEQKIVYNLQILSNDIAKECEEIFNIDLKSAKASSLVPSQDSHGQDFESFEILQVAKIDHPGLKDSYEKKKEKMKNLSSQEKIPKKDQPYTFVDEKSKKFYEKLGLTVDENTNEFFFYQCPKQNFVDNIIEFNANEHYSNGGLVGRAIYFAERPMKADEYAYKFKPEYEKMLEDKYAEKRSNEEIQRAIDRKFPGLEEANEQFEEKDREILGYLDEDIPQRDQEEHTRLWEAQKKKKIEKRKEITLQDDTQIYQMLVFRVNMGKVDHCMHPKKRGYIPSTTKPLAKDSQSVFVNCQEHMKESGHPPEEYTQEKCRLKNYREVGIYKMEQVCPVLVIKYRRIRSKPNNYERQIETIKALHQRYLFQRNQDENSIFTESDNYFVEPTCQGEGVGEKQDALVFKVLQAFLQSSPKRGQANGLLIQGEAGSGKSTILFQFYQNFWTSIDSQHFVQLQSTMVLLYARHTNILHQNGWNTIPPYIFQKIMKLTGLPKRPKTYSF